VCPSRRALDDFDEALEDYSKEIRLDRDLGEAYYYRGVAHREKGDQRRGKTDQDRANRLDPTLEGN
jgi:tetratricopeptide (TPR) repeat protein